MLKACFVYKTANNAVPPDLIPKNMLTKNTFCILLALIPCLFKLVPRKLPYYYLFTKNHFNCNISLFTNECYIFTSIICACLSLTLLTNFFTNPIFNLHKYTEFTTSN